MILAHMHQTEDVPIQDMVNSLLTSRGQAVHRYGIDPWRVSGGESWTSSYGKQDPGNTRLAQVRDIVARADVLAHGVSNPPPPPPPPPPIPTPPRFTWNLPAGHYYGNISGPSRSHGGYYASERWYVQTIQQWLIWHGCARNANPDWRISTWDDGIWGAETDVAMCTVARPVLRQAALPGPVLE